MVLTRHIEQPVEVSENGKTYKYTCYGDHENKNKFYVVPQTPEYAIDSTTGKPKFVMYTFRGDAQKSEDEGGFTVFTVKLPFPSKGSPRYDKVKQKLMTEVNSKLERRANKTFELIKQYGNTPDGWKKVGETFGYSQQQLELFQAGYEEAKGYKQFVLLPEDAQVELAAVPFTSGQAALTIANGPESFFEKKVSPAMPSMMGDNETVFAISLTAKGAAFFKEALWGGEGGSIAGVTYTFTADSLLPPVTVTVTYNSSKTKAYARTIRREPCTRRPTSEELRETYLTNKLAEVNVDFLAKEGLSDEQADKLEKELREWGVQQLEGIVSNQIGGTDIGTDLGQRFAQNPDNVSELVKDTYDEKRVLKLLRPVEFTIRPQDQLSSIKVLVGEENKDEYFPEVDLNAEFFKKLVARVQVNAQFEKLGIFGINVKLRHGSDTPSPFVFNEQNRGEIQEAVWYKDGLDEFEYSYVVNYENESKTFESNPETREGSDIVTINVGNAGILQVNIKQGDIDWDLVERAQVIFRYPDAGIEDQRILTPDIMTAEPFIKPIFKTRNQPILYRTKFFMKDGQELFYAPGNDKDGSPVEWAKSSNSTIYIDDPFAGTQNYTLLGMGLDRKTEAIIATLTYTLPEIGYSATKTVTFSDSHRSESWAVPLAAGGVGHMSYTGFIQFTNGSTREIANPKVEGSIVRVGVEKEGVLEVTINAEEVDFENRLKSAKVSLWYVDSENSVSEKTNFTFKDEDEEDWSVDLKDSQHKEYKYQVLLSHNEKALGEKGKIYLPGPTKNDWAITEGELILQDIIPDDLDLAQKKNMLLVKVVQDSIDWDEVKQVKLKVTYGKEKETFRFNEDDEDEPNPIFLAPQIDGISAQWLAEFRMEDGERVYYPEKGEMIELESNELHLNDYIPTSYGGNFDD